MLTQSDYQKIVDRLINILGKNINIMNTEGVIIASGDTSRIGSLHEGAKIAASSKTEVIINNDNLSYFRGSKKGINIPIFNKEEVTGVVGITGEPCEVLGFGKIIKELVELMIQEVENKKHEAFQSRAIISFVKELFKRPYFDNDEINLIKSRAEFVGFSFKDERIVIVTDIIGFNNYISVNKLNEFQVQELKQNIVDYIKSKLNFNDIVFNFNEDRFIIIKQDSNAKVFCHNLQRMIFEKFNINFVLGIGSKCKSIEDYYFSFIIANRLITIGRKIGINVLTFEEYKIHILFENISNKDKEAYISEYKNLFNLRNKHAIDLVRTIKLYFESGMNIDSASKQLYVHRNTLIYRINKIKEQFNIDITNPFECMKIYMAILLKELSPL